MKLIGIILLSVIILSSLYVLILNSLYDTINGGK